mmetsp:Transcript_32917/g.80007  ORF Transcript_32917/g.80007 Transcript_32917/m.80007 type:complete len:370 (+) Transcript_32917:136-1245(+)|eukprot:CAMPEP_0113469132 /NCGR_PEP_ID=MMETSP0014_2-20120614/15736_1 /TAXON_ID=2857 /ORGANISM="Nitzschia sp." /LENGTH=369 /DNA_ID=CAMNT_0000361589 /DNA_START=100 /DNA_END=1209 /DNA_ORIENTATION=+ /assembly_acc=CAM_ASM_000159
MKFMMKPSTWSLLLLGGAAATATVNAKVDLDSPTTKAAVAEIKQRHEEKFYNDLLDLTSSSSSKTLSTSSAGQKQNQRKTRGGLGGRTLVGDGKGKGKMTLPPMDCDINIEIFTCTATIGTMTVDCFQFRDFEFFEFEIDETMCESVTIQFGYVVTNDQSVAPSQSAAPSTEPSASMAPSSMSGKNGGKGKSDGSGKKGKSDAPSQSPAPSESPAPSPGPSVSLAPSMSGKNGGKGKSERNGKGKSGGGDGLELLAIQENVEFGFFGFDDFASCGGEAKQVEIPDDWVVPPGDFALVSGSSFTFNACECQEFAFSVGAVGGTATGSGKGKDGSSGGTCSDVSFLFGFVDVLTSSSPSSEPSAEPTFIFT